MADLNLRDETNKQLIKLISNDHIETIEEEIEFKLFKLAKKMKQDGLTKAVGNQITQTTQLPTLAKDIKIRFQCFNATANFFMTINVGYSIEEMINQVNAKRLVRKF